ncbi:hypothetical protein [Senegalia massiliensis]|uniref:hypothetical protein n=1 Tax=Senegalia massiliensis TaxID=1720316 RepID=UPI001031442A|nr:hypothetical protein [Senegalia massiliensis]
MNGTIPYPDIYRKLYPKVEDTIMKYYPYSDMDEMPTEEELEKMIDEIYDDMIKEYPEIEEDIRERRVMSRGVNMQRPYYGRRRIFRDFISLILLGSLFNRRRRPYYPRYRDRDYYNYPGYGSPYY